MPPLSILNLSLSGAFVAMRPGCPAEMPAMGSVISLTIVASLVPESMSVKARVVRHAGPTEPAGFAVQFVDLDAVAARRIDGLLLQAIALEHEEE